MREGIVSALNKWIGAFRSPPDRGNDADARLALRPAKPCGSEEAFDDVLDEVMVRFTKALEHLAK
jgi:hypothetical protein